MYATTSLSDWLSGLSAGMAGLALICLALSCADADACYFNPVRAVRDFVESGRVDPLLVAVASVRFVAREFARDAAALLILLCTSPKGELA